jgi:hypothetical protein
VRDELHVVEVHPLIEVRETLRRRLPVMMGESRAAAQQCARRAAGYLEKLPACWSIETLVVG